MKNGDEIFKVSRQNEQSLEILTAPATTFPAKDPFLFGSDLHFLPQRLTGAETLGSAGSAQDSFECIKHQC